MEDKRLITDETMDRLIEWIFCHWPCALEEKEFIQGIFFICDEAMQEAVSEERRRILRLASPNMN